MATINGIQKRNNSSTAKAPSPLSLAINSVAVKERFEKMLGENAGSYLSSVLTVYNNDKLLRAADYHTVLAAAATAASLKLQIVPTLGEAYIVAYAGIAQFQIGYKGLIQLAMRSGYMKKIIMVPVYEGELKHWNKFDETYELGEAVSDNVVGYFAAIETVGGFRKAHYSTKEQVLAHAKRFSKAFNKGPWKTDFDAMACKTVLLPILKTYAPKSIELLTAFENDGKAAVLNEETGEAEYIDVDAENATEQAQELTEGGKVDTAAGEIFTAEEIEASMK